MINVKPEALIKSHHSFLNYNANEENFTAILGDCFEMKSNCAKVNWKSAITIHMKSTKFDKGWRKFLNQCLTGRQELLIKTKVRMYHRNIIFNRNFSPTHVVPHTAHPPWNISCCKVHYLRVHYMWAPVVSFMIKTWPESIGWDHASSWFFTYSTWVMPTRHSPGWIIMSISSLRKTRQRNEKLQQFILPEHRSATVCIKTTNLPRILAWDNILILKKEKEVNCKNVIEQWFSNTVLRAARGSLSPFLGLLAVSISPLMFCVTYFVTAIKQNVSIDLC